MLTTQKNVVLMLVCVLALLCSVTLHAATVTLSGSSATASGCEYVTYTRDIAGNLSVACVDGIASPPTTPPTAPPPVSTPTGCTVLPITWGAQVSVGGPLQTLNQGGEALAFSTVMPARPSAVSSGVVNGTVPMYMSISQNPCEFTQALETAFCAGGGTTQFTRYNSTATTPTPGVCQVTEGATYYFNLKNAASLSGPDTCPSGQTCTFFLAW